jgi:hypothetical protein
MLACADSEPINKPIGIKELRQESLQRSYKLNSSLPPVERNAFVQAIGSTTAISI